MACNVRDHGLRRKGYESRGLGGTCDAGSAISFCHPGRATRRPWGSKETPYEEIGGDPTVRVVAYAFYDIIGGESPTLRAMLPDDTAGSRGKLYQFLSGWTGALRRIGSGTAIPASGCATSRFRSTRRRAISGHDAWRRRSSRSRCHRMPPDSSPSSSARRTHARQPVGSAVRVRRHVHGSAHRCAVGNRLSNSCHRTWPWRGDLRGVAGDASITSTARLLEVVATTFGVARQPRPTWDVRRETTSEA